MRLYYALGPADLSAEAPVPLAVFAPTPALCRALDIPHGADQRPDDLEEAEFWACHLASVVSLRAQNNTAGTAEAPPALCRVVAVGNAPATLPAKATDAPSSARLPGQLDLSGPLDWSQIDCFYLDEPAAGPELAAYLPVVDDQLTQTVAPSLLWFDIAERDDAARWLRTWVISGSAAGE